MLGTGQLPKFEEEMFRTVEPEAGRTLYLIPTAEVPLSALHGGEILPEAELPQAATARSPRAIAARRAPTARTPRA